MIMMIRERRAIHMSLSTGIVRTLGALSTVTALVGAAGLAGPAAGASTGRSAAGHSAAAASVTEYAKWEMEGSHGMIAVPGVDFPLGEIATNGTRIRIADGKSTFMNEFTPFGAQFGSSRGRQYLMFGTARGGKPSTTTLTFATPAPAKRWGFSLGDIDADTVKVSAVGEDDTALTADQLGWQSAFNYCENPPRPSSCKRKVYSDEPKWDPESSTLKGNVRDTDGAAGWFAPTVPVKSLSLEFAVQSGVPVGQLWIAATSRCV